MRVFQMGMMVATDGSKRSGWYNPSLHIWRDARGAVITGKISLNGKLF